MMGLFDLFKNKNDKKKKIEAQEPPKQTPIDRRSIPDDAIDRAQKIWASKDYCEKVYRLYYRDYPEKPFISTDRELYTNWLEQAEQFPRTSIVERKMMVRDKDGLLPGHYQMLYWIKNIHREKVPVYFEYKYGICFGQEKPYLRKLGYLDSNGNLTEKGEAVLSGSNNNPKDKVPHPTTIKEINAGVLNFQDSGRLFENLPLGESMIPPDDFAPLSSEVDQLQSAIEIAKQLAEVDSAQNISMSDIDFDRSCYIYEPMSGTRKAKYPLTLKYYSLSYEAWQHGEPNNGAYWGTVKYLKNHIIGDARLIFWSGMCGLLIDLRTKGEKTFVFDVKTTSPDGYEWVIRYRGTV